MYTADKKIQNENYRLSEMVTKIKGRNGLSRTLGADKDQIQRTLL